VPLILRVVGCVIRGVILGLNRRTDPTAFVSGEVLLPVNVFQPLLFSLPNLVGSHRVYWKVKSTTYPFPTTAKQHHMHGDLSTRE